MAKTLKCLPAECPMERLISNSAGHSNNLPEEQSKGKIKSSHYNVMFCKETLGPDHDAGSCGCHLTCTTHQNTVADQVHSLMAIALPDGSPRSMHTLTPKHSNQGTSGDPEQVRYMGTLLWIIIGIDLPWFRNSISDGVWYQAVGGASFESFGCN